jgi:hypothetical protein
MTDIEIRHFHLFCGLGGGAKDFNRGRARVGNMRALPLHRWRRCGSGFGARTSNI